MKIYKIDVDGVLRDLVPEMCKLYNKEYNENIQLEDVHEYAVDKVFTKCQDASKFFFIDHAKELFLDSPACKKAKEALDLIHKNGDKIVICTWQFTNDNKKFTLDYMNNNGLYYDDICFTKNKHMIKGDVIVDDNPEFLLSETDENTKKVLINSAYSKNVDIPNAERYDSLYEYVVANVKK